MNNPIQKATLVRNSFTRDGIFGVLLDDLNNIICYTLEHAFPTSDGYLPAMIDGVYTCQRRLSPHFGYDVFEVLNVPNHSYIELHRGNYNIDSDGCVLLGEQVEGAMITNSEIAFNAFMARQTGIDTFQLNVR